MIELSNTAAQTIAPGQSLTFDTVLLKTGCAEAHRNNSGIVTLKADCAVYEIHFAANVSATAAGTAQLAISLDGEPLIETTMINSIGTAGDPDNAATATLVKTGCGCCGKISVTNTGTTSVIVSANPALFVKRVA